MLENALYFLVVHYKRIFLKRQILIVNVENDRWFWRGTGKGLEEINKKFCQKQTKMLIIDIKITKKQIIFVINIHFHYRMCYNQRTIKTIW